MELMMSLKELKVAVRYNIWKIVGCGRRSTRYYETQAAFTRYFNKFKNDWYWGLPVSKQRWQAYRFTSDGWEEIPND